MSLGKTLLDLFSGNPGAAVSDVGFDAGLSGNPLKGPEEVFNAAGSAINSITDFLKWIAWIFHPLNILRAVEFVIGFILMGWGIYLFTRPRHGQPSGHPLRELFAMTPIGRAARIRQGRRMGRREGQREAARMEARRNETRSERTSSAHERERINVSARASARRQREGQAHSRRVRGH